MQAEAKKLEDSSLYLNLPATKVELEEKGYSATGKSAQSLGNCTISKDFFQISTLVCSTKLTQNGNVFLSSLLKRLLIWFFKLQCERPAVAQDRLSCGCFVSVCTLVTHCLTFFGSKARVKKCILLSNLYIYKSYHDASANICLGWFFLFRSLWFIKFNTIQELHRDFEQDRRFLRLFFFIFMQTALTFRPLQAPSI